LCVHARVSCAPPPPPPRAPLPQLLNIVGLMLMAAFMDVKSELAHTHTAFTVGRCLVTVVIATLYVINGVCLERVRPLAQTKAVGAAVFVGLLVASVLAPVPEWTLPLWTAAVISTIVFETLSWMRKPVPCVAAVCQGCVHLACTVGATGSL
jgi:hypothetical protein